MLLPLLFKTSSSWACNHPLVWTHIINYTHNSELWLEFKFTICLGNYDACLTSCFKLYLGWAPLWKARWSLLLTLLFKVKWNPLKWHDEHLSGFLEKHKFMLQPESIRGHRLLIHGFITNEWHCVQQWPSGGTVRKVLDYAEWWVQKNLKIICLQSIGEVEGRSQKMTEASGGARKDCDIGRTQCKAGGVAATRNCPHRSL